jgi:hypothetical protein
MASPSTKTGRVDGPLESHHCRRARREESSRRSGVPTVCAPVRLGSIRPIWSGVRQSLQPPTVARPAPTIAELRHILVIKRSRRSQAGHVRRPLTRQRRPNPATVAIQHLAVAAHLTRQDGEMVSASDILAKIPREITETKDVTAVCRTNRACFCESLWSGPVGPCRCCTPRGCVEGGEQPEARGRTADGCIRLQTSPPAASGLFASRLPPKTGSPCCTDC